MESPCDVFRFLVNHLPGTIHSRHDIVLGALGVLGVLRALGVLGSLGVLAALGVLGVLGVLGALRVPILIKKWFGKGTEGPEQRFPDLSIRPRTG